MPYKTVNKPTLPKKTLFMKFIMSSIFFLLILSIMIPAYSPQKNPKKVINAYNKEKMELLFISAKYQGIEIIVMLCAKDALTTEKSNKIIIV